MRSSSPPSHPLPAEGPDALWVVCLCADWCGVCRDYAEVFAQTAARHPAIRFAWLDIEEHAGLVGELEVETFPTLLMADAAGLRFFGPVPPQAQTLSRLLDSLAHGDAGAVPHAAAAGALLQAVKAVQAAPQYWVGAAPP